MKKRIFLTLAVTVIVLLLIAVGVSAADIVSEGTCGENATYTLDTDGVLRISGTGDMYDYSSSTTIPWYSNRSYVKTVIIENGITSIGEDAFSFCANLTSVTIPDSVTIIGVYAFSNCIRPLDRKSATEQGVP